MDDQRTQRRRRRQRVYRKQGRSPIYLEIKEEFEEKLKSAALKYKEKIIAEVSEGKRGSSYPAIRKLGSRDFEVLNNNDGFEIPEFVEDNFSDEQSAEALADFFSSISQEFEPIDTSSRVVLIQKWLSQVVTKRCSAATRYTEEKEAQGGTRRHKKEQGGKLRQRGLWKGKRRKRGK